MSALKNLRGRFYPADVPLYSETDDRILAAAAGSYGGLGLIGTLPATTGTLLVRCDCTDRAVSKLAWQVQCDNGFKYTLYVSRTNVATATITLADATAVDDTDTFLLNGLTFTAEATEGDADPAARKYWTGADNAACAVNLAAMLNHATYGVPGVVASAPAAVDATDVITLTTTTAPVLQFAQGTSAANEIAFSDTSLARLVQHTALSAAVAANATTDGELIEMDVNGWPHAYILIANQDGDPATVVVRAIRY